jgi:transcriptional regulator with XRE-family HTH domain
MRIRIHKMHEESIVSRLAARLVSLRKKRGISLLQLADEAKVSVSVAHGAEAGRDARVSTWVKLFDGLGYRLEFEALELDEEIADVIRREADRRWARRNEGLCAGKRRFY